MYLDSIKILKISYDGVIKYISCERTLSYENLQKIVIRKFQISMEESDTLEFCDSEGYRIDEQAIKYLIFSGEETMPDIIFIRIVPNNFYGQHRNNSVIRHRQTQNSRMENKFPFSNSKYNNRIDRNYGSPLRRQNCFIGQLPSTHANGKKRESRLNLFKIKKELKSIRI